MVQSRYESQVRFLIGGNFNKVDIGDILESNGALHQISTVSTRKNTTLELVITDMATLLHPPTTLDPIKQDDYTTGKPSDHNVVIVAPRSYINFKVERRKKKVHVRPMPDSKVPAFMRDIGTYKWDEVYQCEEAYNFHQILLHKMNKYLPEKTVKITSLDKTWFHPALKLKYNEMQKEYYKHGQSDKSKILRSVFRKSKRKTSKNILL